MDRPETFGLFTFITNEDLRASLEGDYAELETCFKGGAWKAVHVMAGSIVEAVLTDYLLATDYQKKGGKDPQNMMLAGLIEACLKEKIISPRSGELSTAIKEFRNLIHPGR